MINTAHVCVLVVTFNRAAYLTRLLPALQLQTQHISDVVIFDNHSSDATQELLVEQGIVESPLSDGDISIQNVDGTSYHCIRSIANTGGSGGFHEGFRYAKKLECDYLWAMDDDVLPASDCLERLLAQMNPRRRICIPNRSTQGFVDCAITHVDMSNPFLYNIVLRKTMVPADQLTEDVIQVEDMPFEGPLIDTTLIDEIGLPNKDLFIIFDDSEYCMRALQHTDVGFVRSAHLYKQILPKTNHVDSMNWKNYYGYRNQYWFDRKYGKNAAVRLLRPFFSRCDLTLRAIARCKWSNIHIISRAYHDGTHGILGKLVEPGGRV